VVQNHGRGVVTVFGTFAVAAVLAVAGGARVIRMRVVAVGGIGRMRIGRMSVSSVRIGRMSVASRMSVSRMRSASLNRPMGIRSLRCSVIRRAVLCRAVIRLLSERQNRAKYAHSNSENTGNQQVS
jgi:hypothetical protein